MTESNNTLRQSLPDARCGAGGRPIGSKCRSDCRPPIGDSQAHCSVCHCTLRAISDFDRHRRDGWCLDLPALGLVDVDRLWATPEGHAAAQRSRDLLAARRKAAV